MNTIVICCDTLRADVVDHTWEDHVDTPHLDQLRENSTVFNNAWGEGEPTIPMRRGFFTGMRSYPWRFHIDDRGSVPNIYGWHAIPTAQTTLAEHLLPQRCGNRVGQRCLSHVQADDEFHTRFYELRLHSWAGIGPGAQRAPLIRSI